MISIIICSIDATKFGVICANIETVFGTAAYEIIGIHDAKSLCEGYNRGAARSKGDILIFCHDDIEFLTPAFPERLRKHLANYDVIGCAGTDCLLESRWAAAGDPFVHGAVAYPANQTWPCDRYNLVVWGDTAVSEVAQIQALDGLFLAVKRTVLYTVSFDEVTFDGFHVYDIDFTFAAYLAGFRLAVCKDIVVAHRSGGNYHGEHEQFHQRFAQKYQGRLSPRAHHKSNAGLARNVDSGQILRLLKIS